MTFSVPVLVVVLGVYGQQHSVVWCALEIRLLRDDGRPILPALRSQQQRAAVQVHGPRDVRDNLGASSSVSFVLADSPPNAQRYPADRVVSHVRSVQCASRVRTPLPS